MSGPEVAPPTLLQFSASHYNEKARFALDWKGVSHRRRTLLPGLHVPVALRASGQKAVPVLLDGPRAIADSTRIVEHLEASRPEPPLYPEDPAARERALALEEFFDEEVGPHVRRAFFFVALDHPDYVCSLFANEAGPLARRLYRAAFPLTRAIMRADMKVDAEHTALSRAKLDFAFDRLERELGGGEHLVGDRFTIADLTAAALFTPIVQPPEFPYPWPDRPPAVEEWRAGYATRAGFAWVEEIYRRHRGRSQAVT